MHSAAIALLLLLALLRPPVVGHAQVPSSSAEDGSSTEFATAGGVACRAHAGLTQVAEALLSAPEPPTAARLTVQLARAAVRVPGVHALLLAHPDATRVDAFLGQLAEPMVDAPSVLCGRATGQAGELWLAAPALGSLTVTAGPSPLARIELAPGLREPYLVVMTPGPRFQVLPADSSRVRLPLDQGEPALVQLMATGDTGPRPLATVALSGGLPQIASLHSEDLEAPYHGVVGRLRKRHGVPAVRRNRLLREAALRHAVDVCQVGDVVHVVAGQGPQARLRDRGVEAAAVGEAVARARGPAEAYNSLLRSPSHALTLLHRDFTDVGVATARDGHGHTCLVVLLARFPRYTGR